MSRHAHELERLCTELHSRYGELDPLVLQVQAALEACKCKEASLLKGQETGANQGNPIRARQRQITRSHNQEPTQCAS